MIGLPLAPFPVTYRELWLPSGINENASLPTSIEGGHGLAFTGARRGTTCDGVHGISGVNTSNINLGAIHNNENILYIKIRFKLDQPFSIASATDQYLFGKYDGPNDYLIGWLEADDGMFHMAHAEGGAVEAIVSAEDSWDTGWHTILVSLHNVNGQRLIVDGGAVVTQVGNTTPITLTADFCLLARDDGVSTEGLLGVEVDVVMGIAALTTVQEDNLYAGILIAAATEEYLLDEGRGVTAYNRGSSGAGANGTLDTSCTWKFGQVQQPVISSDGLNGYARATNTDISGNFTIVWCGKVKVAYRDTLGGGGGALAMMPVIINPATDYVQFAHNDGAGVVRFRAQGNGTGERNIEHSIEPNIDDYWILIGVLTLAGAMSFFVNGSLVGREAGVGAMSAAGATLDLGGEGVSYNDPSKPLFFALIDGAFTQKQARVYSRYMKNVFNLPITI